MNKDPVCAHFTAARGPEIRAECPHTWILALRGQNFDLIEIINQNDASTFWRNQNHWSYFSKLQVS